MLIRTEDTPNGNSVKFIVPGESLLTQDIPSIDFPNKEDAVGYPLVERLFMIDYLEGVLLMQNAVVVTKNSDVTWQYLRADIISCIEEFVNSDEENTGVENAVDDEKPVIESYTGEEREVVSEILRIIDDNIRPLLLGDGGNIVFIKYQEGDVYVKLQGACKGCPSSSVTLKHGIQSMLQYYVPLVKQVISV